ncbi:hypothetical protein NBRC10512_006874 [Rhodotorula toruloides]|uniref:RHTO0S11e06810g1_1 n=2 Tax=Rhodotorula toruloides TaxID=5286 RepID=A0A061BG71_RHOTO|nr:uncharacterized protein RHTO_01567 [Rhodotorula toruloides NP11]EMS21507.1 hypothetical protein RHTO_01567 [Rhodotorula toruloides NP11]CDR45967.1 RHTO0S11e06810g1_1 [Rhodotorula toruloides]
MASEARVPLSDALNRQSSVRTSEASTTAREVQADENARQRSITPRRQAPPPPATTAYPATLSTPPGSPSLRRTRTTSSSSSSSTSAAPRTAMPRHRRTKSSSCIHAPIPPPVYPVRSQPIGLSRSSSLTGSISDRLSGAESVPMSPTISGGLMRRTLSIEDFESVDDAEENESVESPASPRPLLTHRSESLPCFPPEQKEEEAEKADRLGRKAVSEDELASLPPNPKLWLPSHLSLYLASHLSLPPPMRADISSFISSSRLSGRTFLRLREQDLEELGVNIRWRKALMAQRELLRREALGGRVLWGFGSSTEAVEHESPVEGAALGHARRRSVDVEGSADEDESSKEEWKRSWRRALAAEGGDGRSRVQGLRKTFEAVEELSERGSPAASPEKKGSLTPRRRREYPRSPYVFPPTSPTKHGRSDSTASDLSAASVDSVGGTYDGFAASSRRPHMKQLSLASSSSSSKASSRTSLRLEDAFGSLPSNEALIPSHSASTSSFSPTLVTSPIDLAKPSLDVSTAQGSLLIPAIRGDDTIKTARDTANRRRVSFYDTDPLSSATPAQPNEAEDIEADEAEETLRPVRAQNTSAGSAAGFASPPMSPTKGSLALAELFGLDVPAGLSASASAKAADEKKDEADLMTMFVSDRHGDAGDESDETASRERRKKGSLVLIKRSQFHALQQRIDEVEAQLALALSNTPSSAGRSRSHSVHGQEDEDAEEWAYKGDMVGEETIGRLEGKLHGLELQAQTLSDPSLPSSPSPSARAFASSASNSTSPSVHTRSRSSTHTRTRTASTQTSPSISTRLRRRKPSEGAEVWDVGAGPPAGWPNIEGWRQLSGYVVAASIGIGIVAGEVVAAKLFGLRRR